MAFRVEQANFSLPESASNDTQFQSHRYSHPVECVQLNQESVDNKLKNFAITNVFGQQLAIHYEAEKQIYSQFKRLPTLPSSMVALESVLGLDEDFDFEDFLNDPLMSEKPMPTLHDAMEIRLGLVKPKSLKNL